ncbi:hypothetical protein [Pseudorhodoplanes sp.]|uniref:hypothetical protein n=1 Tax=Pseudorhodoplanes sp. TaxID=1934341 RepID=UPI00391B0665
MCLACEEADMYYRWQLIQQIARGEMPEGHSEDDLRAMGLPLPGEIEVVEEPDGTKVVRQKPPAPTPRQAKTPETTAQAFACDSPDA